MSDTHIPHPGEQTLEPRRCPICDASFTGGVSGWILDDLFVGPHCSDFHYIKGCVLALQKRCKALTEQVEAEQKLRYELEAKMNTRSDP